MILRTCAADFDSLHRFHENIEAMGIPALTMETKKPQLKLIIERLPILTQQLKDFSQKDTQYSEAIGSLYEDIQSLSERMEEKEEFDLFSINLDLLWIIERSAKILIEGSKVSDMAEIQCLYPEAFTTWSYEFTKPLQLTPLKLHEIEHTNLISLGQKYSVSDYRRCCYVAPTHKEAFLQLNARDCHLEWSNFNELYQGWVDPAIIPPQQVELSHEKLEAFDKLQMSFQEILSFIQKEFTKAEDSALLVWFHDETLQERMTMEFDHQEEPENRA